MAFDVSALAAYTQENQESLVVASLFDAKTQQLIISKGNVLSDVSSSKQINALDTDANFQAGGGCGFNASGTTTFSRRALTVGKIKVHESLCPKTLKDKYLQLVMKAGSQPEEVPFEEEYTKLKAGKIAQQNEVAIWQGDTASGTANLNKFDGFIKIIDDSGVAINGNTGGVTVATGITESNVRAIIKGIWQAIPAKLKGKDDVAIFCGWDVYEAYIAALIEANLFAYTASNNAQQEGEISIPGTNYKLVAVHGLDGTDRIFAMRYSNMYLGVDVLGEEDKFEIFYAKEAMEVRFVAEWKLGVQIAFPNEVVSFELVP